MSYFLQGRCSTSQGLGQGLPVAGCGTTRAAAAGCGTGLRACPGRGPGPPAGRHRGQLSWQLEPVSDSLNISPRARWVVCPWAAPEGTAGGLYIPGGFENTKKRRFHVAMAVSPLYCRPAGTRGDIQAVTHSRLAPERITIRSRLRHRWLWHSRSEPPGAAASAAPGRGLHPIGLRVVTRKGPLYNLEKNLKDSARSLLH